MKRYIPESKVKAEKDRQKARETSPIEFPKRVWWPSEQRKLYLVSERVFERLKKEQHKL